MNDKEKKGFRVGGFLITPKMLIIVGVIIVFVVCFMKYRDIKAKQDYEAYMAELEQKKAEKAQKQETTVVEEVKTQADVLQEKLTKKYGEAPEGFKWTNNGKLVSLLDDADKNYEDVVYTFIRACSILDFSTATKYSTNSSVVKTFENYYNEKSGSNYYKDFLRKQYRFSLTTLEVNDITDIAVLPDGTTIVSISVSCLDLQDKDFWLKDQEAIFDEYYYYDTVEHDITKADAFLYEYLYNSYETEKVGKRSHNIDIIVGKKNGGGWYVENDTELYNILLYEKGKDVVEYIKDLYERYKINRTKAEDKGYNFEYTPIEESDFNNIIDYDSLPTDDMFEPDNNYSEEENMFTP